MSQEETKNEQNLLCIKVLRRKLLFSTRNSLLGVGGNAEGAKDDIAQRGSIVGLNNERIAFLVAMIKALDDVYHHTWQ